IGGAAPVCCSRSASGGRTVQDRTGDGSSHGRLPERPKGADCKSAGIAYGGSNPSSATAEGPCDPKHRGCPPELPPGREVGKVHRVALIAQSAERLHGKEKVKGSIPFQGSDGCGGPVSFEIGPLHRSRRGSSDG